MKMNRNVMLVGATAAVLTLGACGGGEVVVQAELDGEVAGAEAAAEATPLRDMVVQLVPYDRDAMFDSLVAAYPEPEPQIPDNLLQIQDRVTEAQARWRTAESRWNVVRDSLQQLSRRMDGLSRAERRYREMFNAFQALETEERRLRRDVETNFQEFDELQRRLASESAEIRIRRDEWADEAFRDLDAVIGARLEETGREIEVAQTNAAGVVLFRVPPGRWWVHARYELPYQELYWNVPVDVQRGDPVQVRLSRQNAEVRPSL